MMRTYVGTAVALLALVRHSHRVYGFPQNKRPLRSAFPQLYNAAAESHSSVAGENYDGFPGDSLYGSQLQTQHRKWQTVRWNSSAEGRSQLGFRRNAEIWNGRVAQELIQGKGMIEGIQQGDMANLWAVGVFIPMLMMLSLYFALAPADTSLNDTAIAGFVPDQSLQVSAPAESKAQALEKQQTSEPMIWNFNSGSPYGFKRNAEIWNGRVAQLSFAWVFLEELVQGKGLIRGIRDGDSASWSALGLFTVGLGAFMAFLDNASRNEVDSTTSPTEKRTGGVATAKDDSAVNDQPSKHEFSSTNRQHEAVPVFGDDGRRTHFGNSETSTESSTTFPANPPSQVEYSRDGSPQPRQPMNIDEIVQKSVSSSWADTFADSLKSMTMEMPAAVSSNLFYSPEREIEKAAPATIPVVVPETFYSNKDLDSSYKESSRMSRSLEDSLKSMTMEKPSPMTMSSTDQSTGVNFQSGSAQSMPDRGWNWSRAELWNGRFAQIAFVVVFAQELLQGRSVIEGLKLGDEISMIGLSSTILASTIVGAAAFLGSSTVANVGIHDSNPSSEGASYELRKDESTSAVTTSGAPRWEHYTESLKSMTAEKQVEQHRYKPTNWGDAYDTSKWSWELAELWNGRFAQISLLILFLQELLQKKGVIQGIVEKDPINIAALAATFVSMAIVGELCSLGIEDGLLKSNIGNNSNVTMADNRVTNIDMAASHIAAKSSSADASETSTNGAKQIENMLSASQSWEEFATSLKTMTSDNPPSNAISVSVQSTGGSDAGKHESLQTPSAAATNGYTQLISSTQLSSKVSSTTATRQDPPSTAGPVQDKFVFKSTDLLSLAKGQKRAMTDLKIKPVAKPPVPPETESGVRPYPPPERFAFKTDFRKQMGLSKPVVSKPGDPTPPETESGVRPFPRPEQFSFKSEVIQANSNSPQGSDSKSFLYQNGENVGSSASMQWLSSPAVNSNVSSMRKQRNSYLNELSGNRASPSSSILNFEGSSEILSESLSGVRYITKTKEPAEDDTSLASPGISRNSEFIDVEKTSFVATINRPSSGSYLEALGGRGSQPGPSSTYQKVRPAMVSSYLDSLSP